MVELANMLENALKVFVCEFGWCGVCCCVLMILRREMFLVKR